MGTEDPFPLVVGGRGRAAVAAERRRDGRDRRGG